MSTTRKPRHESSKELMTLIPLMTKLVDKAEKLKQEGIEKVKAARPAAIETPIETKKANILAGLNISIDQAISEFNQANQETTPSMQEIINLLHILKNRTQTVLNDLEKVSILNTQRNSTHETANTATDYAIKAAVVGFSLFSGSALFAAAALPVANKVSGLVRDKAKLTSKEADSVGLIREFDMELEHRICAINEHLKTTSTLSLVPGK